MSYKMIATRLALGSLILLATPLAWGGSDAAGHLYGTVETDRGNTYRGLLRWGTEEAFWDDLFHSSKRELPYLEDYASELRRRDKIKIFGWTVGYRWSDGDRSRVFIARFGDIQEINVRHGEKADVMMKDGTVHRVEGYSNDVGATITVHDASLGKVKIEWDDIDRIMFEPVPNSVEPEAYRLYGVLTTDRETFEGYVQWDSQESLSTDKLDGESDDGELSIEMGQIRAIEKRNRRGCWVELKDGRRINLEGTNDVDSSIRGIHVEDERLGRVEVSWDAFERIEFREAGPSGRGYDAYPVPKRLHGKVTHSGGSVVSGDIAFDLDETFSWEMLNGERDDVEYDIPFALIRSIVPDGDASLIVLRNGREVELYDGQDVSDSNDGLVVETGDGDERFIRWKDVERIDFD